MIRVYKDSERAYISIRLCLRVQPIFFDPNPDLC